MHVYGVGTVKRTSVNVDMGLVEQVGRELGSRPTTDAVHDEPGDMIARVCRTCLAERDLDDLTLELLAAIRRSTDRAA